MRQEHLNNKETEGGAAKGIGDSVTFIKICTCTGPLTDKQGDTGTEKGPRIIAETPRAQQIGWNYKRNC